ncbi:exported protein of unknown function [Nitrospira sp. KM1]|uniref:PepSY domain-containing protein n=1 Tax=Nitrospira sp. KM1 TaxID=1936990 RepID=UPI0013A7B22F|nr:PepSY domain-containing protein [Nitrospira sp. KM1]BCA55704.1 exported protein of unknown function [Nitrospira sp. KM1]
MKQFAAAVVMTALLTSPSWALFESNKELSKGASVTLDKAVQAAVAAMPGKAVEAQIGREEGRTVYKVEIIDNGDKTRMVYVDAQTMQVKIDK